MGVLKWLIKSKTGNGILVGIFVLAVVGVVRVVYFEMPEQEARALKTSGIDAMERAAEKLEEAVKAGTLKDKPVVSDWFPKTYACGIDNTLQTVPPFWKQLGFQDGEKTRFEYRLDTTESGYRMIARTDSDCDGVFATYTISGSTDWTSTFTRKTMSENVKE